MKIVKQSLHPRKAKDDSLDFVLSDGSTDRMGDIIDPAGWDIAQFQKNPIALFNHRSSEPIGKWVDVRTEGAELRGTLQFADPGIARIDELRALTEQGILRAVSVGFRPIEYETFKHGDETGIHFKRQELLETSLVSIPANSNALAIAKSLNLSDATRALIFGKHADQDQDARRQLIIGKHAALPLLKSNKPMNMQKRVEDAQARLVQLKDQLTEHLKTYDETTTDEAHLAAQVELNEQIELAQKALDTIKKSETMLALSSEIVVARAQPELSPHRPIVHATAKAPALSVADHVVRTCVALMVAKAKNDGTTPLQAMAQRYGDDGKIDERSAIMLRAMNRPDGIHFADSLTNSVQRAATAVADSTVSGWASQLALTTNAPFMDLLLPASVWPGLRTRGLAMNFGKFGTISIPARVSTPTIAGAFVLQGNAIPVKQGAVTSTPLTPKKMGVISTFTREIAEHSTPSIEALIRNWMQEDTSVALDTVLLDATAATATRPAGIRAGVAAITATAGGGFAALVGDLKGLLGALITSSNGNIRKPVWIMNPIQSLAISLTQNAGGDFPFKAEINQGNFQGYPVLLSSTVPAGMVILLDAADFVAVEGDAPRFDVSDQATLHMDDAPTPISATGSPNTVAAPIRSLYQTDSMALRMIMDINWTFRRTGMIAWTQSVTW